MDKRMRDSEAVHEAVRSGYGAIARETDQGCCSGFSCCGASPAEAEKLAQHVGYSMEELQALPDGANMGLSCGNPNALAALKEGEVVVDLGSGGGFDVFIAARNVGAAGRAIGVDMTPDMLAKARRNVAAYRERSGLDNVEFRLGEIENLPLADASVDVVISNCVLNLSPEKGRVWKEISRVLKPGGRVAVSDLALLRPLPESVAGMVEALIGCVAGAVLVSETERMMVEAGLEDIQLNAKAGYVEAMVDWQDPLYRRIVAELPEGLKPSDYITSLDVSARKPVATGAGVEGLSRDAVNELVALGAAAAIGADASVQYHEFRAKGLGVVPADVAMAKDAAMAVRERAGLVSQPAGPASAGEAAKAGNQDCGSCSCETGSC